MNTEALEKRIIEIVENSGRHYDPKEDADLLTALSTFITDRERKAFEAGRLYKDDAALDFGLHVEVEFQHKDYESYSGLTDQAKG